jgi:hypothetical protein
MDMIADCSVLHCIFKDSTKSGFENEIGGFPEKESRGFEADSVSTREFAATVSIRQVACFL